MRLPRRKVWDLAGEAQINDDGMPRQRVLAVLHPGDPLSLQRQPDNPHDANAVAVLAGKHVIGFIPRAQAAQVAALLDAGEPHRAQLHELTGGLPDYPSFGAKICIAWRDLKMLEPLPLQPDQTLHQSMMAAPDATKGGGSMPVQIIGGVAFLIVCIIVAVLI